MFGIGFSEMLVIALVALVVIGPERLPGVARTAGALFGRAQRYVTQLKADIQNEVDLEELNRVKSTFYDAAKSFEHSVGQAGAELDAAARAFNEGFAVQPETPATAAIERAHAPLQLDLGLDSTSAASPASVPKC
jgi:sec-independent protein translocase protein TatB